METGIKVGDVMKTRLVSTSEDSSIYEAAKQMKKNNVSGLLVTNAKGDYWGMITDADIVERAIAPKKLSAEVKEIASKPLAGVDVKDDISKAAREMARRDVKRLAVFNEKKVVGIISMKDIIRISPSLYDLVAEKTALTAMQ